MDLQVFSALPLRNEHLVWYTTQDTTLPSSLPRRVLLHRIGNETDVSR